MPMAGSAPYSRIKKQHVCLLLCTMLECGRVGQDREMKSDERGNHMYTIRDQNKQFVFGNFILRSNRILYWAGKPLATLPPKEYSVLTLLAAAQGEWVSKAQLLDVVWGAQEVSESSLTRCIYVLRRLLQQKGKQGLIETLYGNGYRLTCPVTVLAVEGTPTRHGVLLANNKYRPGYDCMP